MDSSLSFRRQFHHFSIKTSSNLSDRSPVKLSERNSDRSASLRLRWRLQKMSQFELTWNFWCWFWVRYWYFFFGCFISWKLKCVSSSFFIDSSNLFLTIRNLANTSSVTKYLQQLGILFHIKKLVCCKYLVTEEVKVIFVKVIHLKFWCSLCWCLISYYLLSIVLLNLL